MAMNVVEETQLDPVGCDPEEEVENLEQNYCEELGLLFSDSENEVNDGDFHYDELAPERVTVGLNFHTAFEGQEDTSGNEEEIHSDNSDYPSCEELLTDYSSGEEGNITYPAFNEEKEMWDPKFDVGKTFSDVQQFGKAVKNHGVATGCNLKMKTNDDRRAQVFRKYGCPWRIWASRNKKLGCIQIKVYNSKHTCIREGTNRHCTTKYIAERYIDTFKLDPEWKTKLIRKRVRDDLKINIVRQTAARARRLAKILIEGSDDHQFGLLWSFAEELLRTNPGSTCRIAVHESKFQGIYVCVEACKRGFMTGCRQLIGLDGCFLKGSFGGQMLVAVAMDANDCIYPLAFAIVERENTTSWRWFMRHLGGDLRIVNCNEWTFMSDRQKGLQNVIADMYPDAEHRFCVRHMYTNFFRAEFRGLALKEILWKAAKSTTIPDYNYWMQEMKKVSKPVFEWLLGRHPKEWSKSHFLTKVKSDILLNNLCECFNKVVLEDREKSIVTMLIDMHISCMKRIQGRRDKMKRVTGPLTPKIHDKLNKNLEWAEGSEVDWSGGPQWYVRSKDGEFVVDLLARTCTCRKWDLTSIPCAHACAAIRDKRDQPMHYVHDCYRVSTYLICYDNLIMPLNGKKLWFPVDKEPLRPPRWQVSKKGRKQKKRRMQAEELVTTQQNGARKMKKQGTITITCSLCGLPGHNRRYHDKREAPREYIFEEQTLPRSKEKLCPRRSKTVDSTSNALTKECDFQFIPTPGIGVPYHAREPENSSALNMNEVRLQRFSVDSFSGEKGHMPTL